MTSGQPPQPPPGGPPPGGEPPAGGQQPGYGQQPGHGQPSYGQPSYGQPQWVPPQPYGQQHPHGQPQAPYYGQHPHDQPPPPPAYGQPGHGQPGHGQPGHGQPGYGQPPYGQPPYGPPGAPNPFSQPAGTGGRVSVDRTKLTMADYVIAGGTLVYLVLAALPWYDYDDFYGFSYSFNGFTNGLVGFAFVLFLLATVWALLPAFTEVRLGFPRGFITVGLTALGFLFTLLAWFDTFSAGFSVFPLLGVLVAGAILLFAVLSLLPALRDRPALPGGLAGAAQWANQQAPDLGGHSGHQFGQPAGQSPAGQPPHQRPPAAGHGNPYSPQQPGGYGAVPPPPAPSPPPPDQPPPARPSPPPGTSHGRPGGATASGQGQSPRRDDGTA